MSLRNKGKKNEKMCVGHAGVALSVESRDCTIDRTFSESENFHVMKTMREVEKRE